jgi:hypothetical protein
MSEIYQLEKWVWSEADFEVMGWHDSRIHALAFLLDEFEMVFDIDYILQWVHPQIEETHFKFWVSPATLVFENVYDVEFDIGSFAGKLEIDSIKRDDERPPRNGQYIKKQAEWKWIIICQEGEIRFHSTGYKQYIRANPILISTQILKSESRGVSFLRDKID